MFSYEINIMKSLEYKLLFSENVCVCVLERQNI